ncbi:MAG: cytidylate kinase-like family protein [Lachnospiraceae bacterium]|nr:cytidylate kinase-like family protein [Lachnospiraceae bacterium]
MSKIICISREYGSGGHEIAKKTAQLLGISCLDKEILEHVLEKSDLPNDLIVKADEKRKNSFRYTAIYEGSNREYYGMAINDILYEMEKNVILEKAEEGDCIIVGRCAEEILKDTDHAVVSLFITAPLEFRLRRKMEEAGTQDRRKVEKEIKKMDKQRRAYYEYHTGKDWGIPYNYDVCLNSASMGINRIIDVMVDAFGSIWEVR